LDTETIKECRALKTLASMLLRLCDIKGIQQRQLGLYGINKSWGELSVGRASKVRYSRRQPRGKHGKFASINRHSITRRQAAVAAERRRAARNKTQRAKRRAILAANAAAKKMNEFNDNAF
jgi:hypothetical protein